MQIRPIARDTVEPFRWGVHWKFVTTANPTGWYPDRFEATESHGGEFKTRLDSHQTEADKDIVLDDV